MHLSIFLEMRPQMLCRRKRPPAPIALIFGLCSALTVLSLVLQLLLSLLPPSSLLFVYGWLSMATISGWCSTRRIAFPFSLRCLPPFLIPSAFKLRQSLRCQVGIDIDDRIDLKS